jgi:hypothetical protein
LLPDYIISRIARLIGHSPGSFSGNAGRFVGIFGRRRSIGPRCFGHLICGLRNVFACAPDAFINAICDVILALRAILISR